MKINTNKELQASINKIFKKFQEAKPSIREVDTISINYSISINDTASFVKACTTVASCIDENRISPISGIHFDVKDNKIIVVGSDGVQLSKYECTEMVTSLKEASITVHPYLVKVLTLLVPERRYPRRLNMNIENDTLIIRINDTAELKIPSIYDHYVRYKEIFPAKKERTATLETRICDLWKIFDSITRMNKPFDPDDNYGIATIHPDTTEVAYEKIFDNTSICANFIMEKATHTGNDVTFHIDTKFLANILKPYSKLSKKITLHFYKERNRLETTLYTLEGPIYYLLCGIDKK